MGLLWRKWGDEAYGLIKQIKGQHSTKKKNSLIALADAAYAGGSVKSALVGDETGSRTAHYKWLDKDPSYAAAYNFLVGSEDAPGIALSQRLDEEAERQQVALSRVAKARNEIQVLSLTAVQTLQEALSATRPVIDDGVITETYADHSTRITAANSLLDRVPETSRANKTDITSDGERLEAPVYILENRPDD